MSKLKVEYQQYPDGSHVCVATEKGNWIADCGKEGYLKGERYAELFARAPELLKENEQLKKELYQARVFISNIGLEKAELLEALKDALKQVSEGIRNESIDLDVITDESLTIWESAIAKADGKTK